MDCISSCWMRSKPSWLCLGKEKKHWGCPRPEPTRWQPCSGWDVPAPSLLCSFPPALAFFAFFWDHIKTQQQRWVTKSVQAYCKKILLISVYLKTFAAYLLMTPLGSTCFFSVTCLFIIAVSWERELQQTFLKYLIASSWMSRNFYPSKR